MNLRVGSLDHSKRAYVPIAVERIDCNELASWILVVHTNKYFSVHGVDSQLVHVREFHVRTFDDANRSFVSIGAGAEKQNRLSLELRHHNLVFDRIVSKLMNGPRDQRVLTENVPSRCYLTIRQPGECRNLRVAHSAGHEQLVSFGIVDQPHVDHRRRGRTFGSAADRAQRRRISRSIEFKNRRIVVAEVRYPKFLVLRIDGKTRWILNSSLGTCKDSDWSDVSFGVGFENENLTRRIVGHEDLPVVGVHGYRYWVVQ